MTLLLCIAVTASMLAGCSLAESVSDSNSATATATASGGSVPSSGSQTAASGTSGSEAAANRSGRQTTAEYATKIFGAEIITLEITADPAEWQQMLDTAIEENYIKANVVVNGTLFTQVGIRPKGNSSLKEVANSGSDRFSFRLKFDEYVKGQTCFGLDTFVVNNMLGDNTYMKEYVSYDLMRTAGVAAPLFGFTNIAVNGKAWGLYLAVEAYNDSYQKRVSGNDDGNLYNVKMVGGANAGAIGGAIPGGRLPNAGGKLPNAGGRMGAAAIGGALQYTDDNPSSYKAIFENAVGKSSTDEQMRVVAAIKALSAGTDLERFFDVDAILRYLAAHTIVVNLDSYSSMMAQNYYLYEKAGKVTILPWDYNLAWGGFQGGLASGVVNFPIDTPVSGVEMSARPLLDKLLSNPAYKARYHQYLQQLIDQYFANGRFEAKVQALSRRIASSVKSDATAFCTYADYEKAVSAFVTLGSLRAQSVQGQLAGTVPSTTAEQAARPGQLVSAGTLSLRDLGTMGGGGEKGIPGGKR